MCWKSHTHTIHVKQNKKMLITDKNDLSHFHGNNPTTNHGGRIHHQHHPPPPPQPPIPIIGGGGSKQMSRKSKSYHNSQQPNNSYPTPNHMENKVEHIYLNLDSGIKIFFWKWYYIIILLQLLKSILHWDMGVVVPELCWEEKK